MKRGSVIKKNAIHKGWHFRLSKKSSLCWAFSIFYDIIIMGDEKCLNEEKWSVEFMKL